MREIFATSAYLGVFLSLMAFAIGRYIHKRFPNPITNPLLLAGLMVIAVLLLLHIDYEDYERGAEVLNYMLTPATVCFALPLYEQFSIVRKNAKALIVGIVAGVLISLASLFALSLIFRFDHLVYISLLPKSITTAFGIALTQQNGGYVALTSLGIVITGIFGNIGAEMILKLAKIEEPVAKGVAIGTSSHVIGTTKALEIGELEGAVSSLSLILAGILTVLLVPLFMNLI